MSKTDDGKKSEEANEEAENGANESAKKAPKEVLPRSSVTHHELTLGGKTIAYTATAGTLVLKDDEDKPRASVFFVAYTQDGAEATERPVTFAFNGGPGSASLWLQLGTFGPRRVDFPDAVQPPPGPYGLVDNEQSILDLTDLVFIDPVLTGYSKAEGEAKAEEFLALQPDVATVSAFIRRWVTENQRWRSPKYVAGESYGTTRAAGVLGALHDQGMAFHGAILVSTILDFATVIFEGDNDLPPVLHLPTYAATAWYHDALPQRPKELEPFLDEVREFARGEYLQALFAGARLDSDTRAQVAQKLHRYTGIDPSFIVGSRLRLEISRFCKELLRQRGRTVGRLDTRYLGRDHQSVGDVPEHDPAFTAALGPYTAVMQDYLRRELEFEEDRAYQAINMEANRKWNWAEDKRLGYPSTMAALRKAMLQNTHLRLFVANGYYDLATPFFAAEHTIDHLGIDSEDYDRVAMTYYEAGHMMYIHPPSLAKLKRDLRAWFEPNSSTRPQAKTPEFE
ncbi:MAG: peptidase S10 [Myxococcota bacterium]